MRAFIERHMGKLLLLTVISMFLVAKYSEEWSERAVACHAKEGKLIYGGCHALVKLD